MTDTCFRISALFWFVRGLFGILGLAVGLTAGSSLALAQADPPAVQALIEQAKKEATLRLSWGEATLGGSGLARQMVARMNKRYGTNIELRFTPIEALARIASQLLVEFQSSQPAFSDLYMGTAAQLVPLLERKMFLPIAWTGLAPGRISAQMIDADGASLKVVTGLTGALYNTDALKQAPKDFFDFLKPEWKGKVATTVFGAGFDGLAANGMWGPEKTLQYVRDLAPQLGGFINCTDTERIAVNEFSAFVLDCVGDKLTIFQEKGAPLEMVLQPDATARRYFYFQVPRHARSPAAATLFALFAHSVEGQKMLWDEAKLDLALYPESQMAKRIAKYEAAGVKFTDVTIPWWQAHPEIGPTVEQIVKILAQAKR
ncbi:MAG: ABC transporter substrate-binding protein [Rhizobiales bacterium]|mgnify:CR=1 FL=1|nr:ABC transporter substrate-binding protein [Hyphomicrobiales bacterium]